MMTMTLTIFYLTKYTNLYKRFTIVYEPEYELGLETTIKTN